MNTNQNTPHKPGDSVTLGGIAFHVLDDNYPGPSPDERCLFILASDTQGASPFDNTGNNYAKSILRTATENWLQDLAKRCGVDLKNIRERNLDLETVDGYKGYGTISVKAAPLTMDEARKYASVLLKCNKVMSGGYWLATGWGNPELYTCESALIATPSGCFLDYGCTIFFALRPALVIPPWLLDSESERERECGFSLSDVPTEDLLRELRDRLEIEDGPQ